MGSDALNKAAGEEAGSAVAVASQATMREETHGWADSLVRGRGQGSGVGVGVGVKGRGRGRGS